MMVTTDILALNCYLRKKPEAAKSPEKALCMKRPHHTQVLPWNSKRSVEGTPHLFGSTSDILVHILYVCESRLLFFESSQWSFHFFLSLGPHWGAGGGAGSRAGHESQGMLHSYKALFNISPLSVNETKSRWALNLSVSAEKKMPSSSGMSLALL